MWTWVLGNKKLIGQIGAAVGLLVVLYQLHDHIYQSGIKSCQAASQAALAEQVTKMQADQRKAVRDALDLQNEEHQAELSRVRDEIQIVEKTKTVKEYVDRIVEIPAGCDQLASDVISLLRESTNTVIGASSGETGNTGKP